MLCKSDKPSIIIILLLYFFHAVQVPHVRGSRVMASWALLSTQATQLETFRNSCMHRIMGRYRGTGDPSTAELLDVTGQVSITQLLRRHRVRWLGHAPRKPRKKTGRRPVGCPHYTCLDGWGHAGPQHPRAPATAGRMDLLRDWPKLVHDRDLRRGGAS